MANRTVLGALPGGGFGLKVSKPGFNVLSTGLAGNQVSFDSRWPAAAKIFKSGSVAVPKSSTAFQYVTVSFGKTFASLPPVLLLQQIGSNFLPMVQPIDGGSNWTDSAPILWAQILTSSMRFYRGPINDYTVHYIILDDL